MKQLEDIVEIPLRGGGFVLINECDAEKVSKHEWSLQHPNKTPTVRLVNIPKNNTLLYPKRKKLIGISTLARYIMDVYDNSLLVVNRDHNPLNCTRSNLIKITRGAYQHQLRENHKQRIHSKYKGVIPYREFGSRVINPDKWISQIVIDCKIKHLGVFNSQQLAADAYNKKAIEIYGDNANLNEIEW